MFYLLNDLKIKIQIDNNSIESLTSIQKQINTKQVINRNEVIFLEFINEPNILLSVINTKLRDEYDSLDALADDLNWSVEEINRVLKRIDYIYNKEKNQFERI